MTAPTTTPSPSSAGTSSGATGTGVNPDRLAGLRRWNLGLSALHAAQAILILVIASDFAITVTSTYPQGSPGTRLTTPEALFDVPIGPAIAVFLLLAALDHFARQLSGVASTRTACVEGSTGSGGWSTRSARP